MKIPKRTKSTRTYKFKLHVDDKFVSDFNNGQRVQRLYFNYGLKYLYQHYGIGHLHVWFPTGMGRKYLASKMINFARDKALTHGFDLSLLVFHVGAERKYQAIRIV